MYIYYLRTLLYTHMYLLAIFLHKYYMKFLYPIRKCRMIHCNTSIFFYYKSYLIYTSCININSNINIAIYISGLIYQFYISTKKQDVSLGYILFLSFHKLEGKLLSTYYWLIREPYTSRWFLGSLLTRTRSVL